jgi:CDP-glucose 4,6-dehydratase
MAVDLSEVFAGKTVFVTGHTGFKGSWLCLWLHSLGARVTGYALAPPTEPNNFTAADVGSVLHENWLADVRDCRTLTEALLRAQPDFVFHLAAQSTVLEGYASPHATFETNVMGSVNLIEALRRLQRRCSAVIVSSDKCYRNDEHGTPFDEDDALGGHDPYSASKAGTELVTSSYRQSFFDPRMLDEHGIALASARAGNVIGGGDWTPHGLIADVVRGLWTDGTISLRYPEAVRPWQHVLEPLGGYLTLAAALSGPDAASLAGAYNFGPPPTEDATVGEVVRMFLAEYRRGTSVVRYGPPERHEATTLRLATDRAAADLQWIARWPLATSVTRTARWYLRYEENPGSARESCLEDLELYARSLQT